MIDINGDLDPSLRDAPIDPLTYHNIEDSHIRTIDEHTIEMEVTYVDGTSSTVTGVKEGANVKYFVDGEFVSETSVEALSEAFEVSS